ncbi:MAG TPA: glycoside hydrolase family 78 protein [Candidatus Limnocylindrales bacterium]|nr:glycoside hydrolase family 78 protein [Candidatus Limnocylindrales bacterium]
MPLDRVSVVGVFGLRAEHLLEPLGIGAAAPRLSWRVTTTEPGWVQTGYEVSIDGVHCGRIGSAEQVLVPWPGSPLWSRERRTVRVRVWGNDDAGSDWSQPLTIEAGLLRPNDWTATMIAPTIELSQADGPAMLLRRDFELAETPVSARLYATALGVYETELNGRRVGDDILAPGWTSYHHRLRYQTYDVTALIRRGGNTISGWLADGWFRGRLGFRGGRYGVYGDRTALLAQLEVECADGSKVVIATDGSWRSATSPITATGLYDGERYDARWDEAGSSWLPVAEVPFDAARLVAPDGPPVRRTEELAPVNISKSPSGKTIVDFGQNLTGRLRLRVNGSPGQTVTLRHAEVLQDGELCVRPLRDARQTDVYTLRGNGIEEWEPRFTMHGFRYAEIEGWPGSLGRDDVAAIVCHTAMTRTGWFSCSDPLLRKLHDNVVWSMRGNFLEVPTDCPQRDERLGWTGDLAVFAPTASFLYDCAGMLASWLKDLAAEQEQLGTVPFYVPWVELLGPPQPAAVWGDAAVAAPWTLHERFGDVGLLCAQYASMRAWVDQLTALAGEKRLWDRGFQFGDWLDPAAPPDRPGDARTDPYLIATAYYAYSARTLARIAALLGEEDDHRRYASIATEVGDAFADEFVTPSGRLASDTQTAYAVALTLDLLDKGEQRERAGRRLVELARAEDHRVGTGFVGTPLICDALTGADAVDTAYHLLTNTQCPSWLYPVTMGATTIWERWDSMLPDGTVNPGEMTSFNHYALGAVADWMHRTVAGLAPAAPGYRRVLVRPRPGGGLTHARAVHDSPYGRIEVAWHRQNQTLAVEVTLPPGTTALVHLPDTDPVEAGSGRHHYTCPFPDATQDPPPPATVHRFTGAAGWGA